MAASIVWSTPNGERHLAFLARVSNPRATLNDPFERLIKFLFRKKHWSPFEMVNVCIEINCPRDVSRQILRHRSFFFQEFSGRYAAYDQGLLAPREARLQDQENRQNSLPVGPEDVYLTTWWDQVQRDLSERALFVYNKALGLGIAKEVARAILPEGLVPTKLYVNGTLRSWIHYIQVRTDPSTQKEHRIVAEQVKELILKEYPILKDVI